MNKETFNVAFIGAGASGLMAAWELLKVGKKVIIIEAKDHVGGRALTINDPSFSIPVESGAEFIHGDLENTISLLKKAGIKYSKVEGEIWQRKDDTIKEQSDFIEDDKALVKKFNEVQTDISIAHFIRDYLQGQQYADLRQSLLNYVEGYYAADANKASTLALKREWQSSDEEQFRIEGGYQLLINYLYENCNHTGGRFLMSAPVKKIHWEKNMVAIYAGDQKIYADAAIITVSLGILQANYISFQPRIDTWLEAARKLGFGNVIKIILQFTDSFWEEVKNEKDEQTDDLGFIFSQQAIPTWWTQFPKRANILTGWVGGPKATSLKDKSDDELLRIALSSLAKLFNIDEEILKQKMRAYKVFNWIVDPFVLGGYAYDTVGGTEARNQLKKPVEGTLYFTGEGVYEGPEIGTVEAALVMGKETAEKLIAGL